MSPEERAALEVIGVKFGTGEPLREFKPLPQPSAWLVFLITLAFGLGGCSSSTQVRWSKPT
jgi:hypothetical protein